MKVGFTCGAFDLLHVGHLHLLKEAKNQCDRLIVGIHVNPQAERENKNKPVQTVMERMIQLLSCKYVDNVVVYETEQDLLNYLLMTTIDVRFLGSDYEGYPEKIMGKDLVPTVFIPRNHTYSSTELRERIKNS